MFTTGLLDLQNISIYQPYREEILGLWFLASNSSEADNSVLSISNVVSCFTLVFLPDTDEIGDFSFFAFIPNSVVNS